MRLKVTENPEDDHVNYIFTKSEYKTQPLGVDTNNAK